MCVYLALLCELWCSNFPGYALFYYNKLLPKVIWDTKVQLRIDSGPLGNKIIFTRYVFSLLKCNFSQNVQCCIFFVSVRCLLHLSGSLNQTHFLFSVKAIIGNYLMSPTKGNSTTFTYK